MPRFGTASEPNAICDRCKMRRPHSFLVSDPNSPGLKVCQDSCVDELDPYRLPARQTEDVTLEFVRPDEKFTQ